jgi:hypothetical protein
VPVVNELFEIVYVPAPPEPVTKPLIYVKAGNKAVAVAFVRYVPTYKFPVTELAVTTLVVPDVTIVAVTLPIEVAPPTPPVPLRVVAPAPPAPIAMEMVEFGFTLATVFVM